MAEPLTNEIKPKTSATLTIRVIKSFTFRTEKSLVLHDVNLLTTTVGGLKERVKQGVHHLPAPFPLQQTLKTITSYPNATWMEALQDR